MADKIIFEVVATAKGVKVVQQQTDKLAKSTDKAAASTDKLGKSRDRYNRKEKGAAQISSNSTKNFSKMQQGIDGGGGSGGLVRAYALLAANVFALTAAFGVLSRSAQIDTLTQSMEILSTTGGTYIKNLAKEMQAASGYAIDLAQAFSQVSLASSAGLSTKEIEGLTAVAKGAAISLGRNLPDAMDRIFRGAIKLEPEILDEIGLFVRVDEAAQKYARNNGKVVSSLSQVEKRQAFLNEILEQGTKKFSDYAENIKPDPYVRIGAALGDVAQSALSLMNGFLGPLLGFLAESKTLLTAVFGTLVAVLLKKAIPAMGLMTKGSAELAQSRADEADAYSKSITKNAAEASKAGRKEIADARKLGADKMKDQKRFVSRAKGDKGTAALDKAKLGSKKRMLAVEERITVLKKAQRKGDSANQIMINKEMKALEREVALEKELSVLKAKGGVTPGSLASRKQEKLDSKARVSGVVAGAAGTMETDSISAGWAKLNTDLKETVEVNGKVQDKFSGTEKAMARMKGGVSAAGVGINKLMMIMGPWMMAFAMLTPLLMAAGKWLGLASVEAAKFDESLTKLADASENLHKRFKTQTDQIKLGKLSMLETAKAQLAFNKGMLEATEGTEDMNRKLDEFKRSASNSAKAWEFFKGLFGMDRESEALGIQLETVRKQVEGLIRESGVEGAKDFMDLQGIKEFIPAVQAAQAAQLAFMLERDAFSEKANKDPDDDIHPLLEGQAKALEAIVGMGKTLAAMDPLWDADAIDLQHASIQASREQWNISDKLWNMALNQGIAEGKLAIVRNKLTGNTTQLTDSQRKRKKTDEDEINRLQILTSVMEGASESIGKFAQGFQVKTKADDLNNSLSGMNLAMVGTAKVAGMTGKELTDFFQKMEDEGDNSFSQIFNKEEIEQFKKGTLTAWKEMVNQVKRYQHNVITTKNKQAELKQQVKEMTAFQAAGQAMNEDRFDREAQIKKKTATLAKDAHVLNLATNKLSEKELDLGLGILEGKGTMLEKEEALLALNGEGDITREKIMAAQASRLAKQTAEREAQLAEMTKVERAEKATAQASLQTLEAQKGLTDAMNERAKLTLKLAASRRGGDVRGIDTVAAELKAAKDTFIFAVESAKLKMAVLTAEHEILKIRMKLFFLEAGKATQDPVTKEITLGKEAQGFMDTLGEGFAAKTSAIGVGIQNAALRFGIATTEAIGNSFKAGSGSGILGAIRGAAAGVDSAGKKMLDADGKPVTDDKGNAIIIEGLTKHEAMVQVLKSSYQELAATMAEFGPAGIIAAGVAQGSLTIMTGYENLIAGNKAVDTAVKDTTNDFGENNRAMAEAANTAEFASTALSGIGQMLAANSKGQIAEIDQQIKMEQKRDGKSKESIAKIAAMEKKKEAMQRKAFETQKKVQMAVTIANTAASIMAAVSAPPIGLGWPAGLPMAIMAGVMGAAQLAIISKTKYSGGGGSVEKPKMAALNMGKRDNKVDVSRGASGGEMSYMRGGRGQGSNANTFRPTGGAYGIRSYGYEGEGILVGEQGPEVVTPTQPVDVLATGTNGAAQNVNFTINTIDSQGVADFLDTNQGAIIQTIRGAANGYGTGFLEEVDTTVLAPGG